MTNRREFISQGTTLLAGVLAGPRIGRLEHPAPPLGVALVGLGNLSTYQLAPALRKTSNCRLAAIVTGTPAKAARWKAQYDIPDRSIYDYATMDRMADNPGIDIVYVVTPNALHAEHTIKAARAGKHVFCEKPMEVSSDRCQVMIDECRRAKRQLGIAYRCQFEPHHLECVRLARTGAFGKVKRIEASFGFPIGDPAQWRLNRALAGGGPLMDVGIYALQTTRMITGEEPAYVQASTTKGDPAKFSQVEESMTFQLGFPGGVVADCRTSYVSGMNGFTVFAERGSFGMTPAYNYGGNRGFRSDNEPLRFAPTDQFATELEDFAQRVITNTPTKVPGQEGLRDIRIMMAAYESARTGRRVTLS